MSAGGTLVLDFADFWPGFDKQDNWLTGVLRQRFDVQLSSTPEVVIYSVYGRAHRDYRCTRLLLSWENRPWGFSSCDFAMTSDYHRSRRHRRLPLWVAWLDEIPRPRALDRGEALDRGFAAIVTSNPSSATRERIHGLLETCGPVASGGRHRNNVGGPVPDKLAFISRYKFSVACENSSYPGYTTEKLLQSLACQTIPIYWGDPCVHREFNPQRFVNYSDFRSDRQFVEYVRYLDTHDDAYLEVLAEPWFRDGALPESADTDALLDWIESSLRSGRTPVARRRAVPIGWLHHTVDRGRGRWRRNRTIS